MQTAKLSKDWKKYNIVKKALLNLKEHYHEYDFKKWKPNDIFGSTKTYK